MPLVIKADSSLISLANLYCHDRDDWRRIAEVNGLRAPYLIHKDTTLLVPAGLLLGENVSAVVGAIRGQARLSSAGMAPRQVIIADNVPPGAMIETGEDGYVLLIFPDQRFVRVDAGSSLRIDLALRLADGSLKIQTTLERGASLNNIKPSKHLNDDFRSRTPTALTGVRGTEYRLKAAEATQVETLRGKVYATAADTTRIVPLGQGLIIRKQQAPSLPRPLPAAPANFVAAEMYKSQPLHFELPEQSGAASMRLTISHDDDGLQVVERRVWKPGASLSVILPEDGLYFATLTSTNTEGFESLPTPPKAFVLRTSPGSPTFTIPEKAHFFTPSASLPWSEVTDAVSYRVMVAKDAGFVQPLHEATVAAPLWKTPDLPLGTYYARVQSVAGDGFQSAWSETAAFTIAEPPKLFNDKMIADGPISLRWTTAPAGVVYDLQVAAEPDFTAPLVVADGLRQPEYILGDEIKPGAYYLRLRSNLPGGQTSPWGPAQKITIAPAPMTLAVKVILAALFLCVIL